MPLVRAQVRIEGRVQGVNFRYYTQLEAKRRSLQGWVRNLWDGRVEAVMEGEQADVEAMIAWCRRGPASARVDKIDLAWEAPTGSFEDFLIRPTS